VRVIADDVVHFSYVKPFLPDGCTDQGVERSLLEFFDDLNGGSDQISRTQTEHWGWFVPSAALFEKGP
jgi:hypothetical protein